MKSISISLFSLIGVLLVFCTSGSSTGSVLEIPVEIFNGKINSDISITQGDQVNLKVTSDKDGVLHIHGYDIKVDIFVDKTSSVEFVALATGSFKLALHEASDDHGDHDHSSGGKKEHAHQTTKDSLEEVIIGHIKVLPK